MIQDCVLNVHWYTKCFICVSRSHSQMNTASTYMWFIAVNKTGFFCPKKHLLLAKGTMTLFQQRKERYFPFCAFQHPYPVVLAMNLYPQLQCAVNNIFLCFLELILTWSLPFQNVCQQFNLNHSWGSPPRLSPTCWQGSTKPYMASNHRGVSVSHLPTVGSMEASTASVLTVPQIQTAVFIQPLGMGVFDEVQMFGHFFRILPGKENTGAQTFVIFPKDTLSSEANPPFPLGNPAQTWGWGVAEGWGEGGTSGIWK